MDHFAQTFLFLPMAAFSDVMEELMDYLVERMHQNQVHTQLPSGRLLRKKCLVSLFTSPQTDTKLFFSNNRSHDIDCNSVVTHCIVAAASGSAPYLDPATILFCFFVNFGSIRHFKTARNGPTGEAVVAVSVTV